MSHAARPITMRGLQAMVEMVAAFVAPMVTTRFTWLQLSTLSMLLVGGVVFAAFRTASSAGIAASVYAMVLAVMWYVTTVLSLRLASTPRNLQVTPGLRKHVALTFAAVYLSLALVLSSFFVFYEMSFLIVLLFLAAIARCKPGHRVVLWGISMLAVAAMIVTGISLGHGIFDGRADSAVNVEIAIALLGMAGSLAGLIAIAIMFPYLIVLPFTYWVYFVKVSPMTGGTTFDVWLQLIYSMTSQTATHAFIAIVSFVAAVAALTQRRVDGIFTGRQNPVGTAESPSFYKASDGGIGTRGKALWEWLPGYDYSLRRMLRTNTEPMRLMPFSLGRAVHISVVFAYMLVCAGLVLYSAWKDLRLSASFNAEILRMCIEQGVALTEARCKPHEMSLDNMRLHYQSMSTLLGGGIAMSATWWRFPIWRTRREQKLLTLTPRWQGGLGAAEALSRHVLRMAITLTTFAVLILVFVFHWKTQHRDLSLFDALFVLRNAVLLILSAAFAFILVSLHRYEQMASEKDLGQFWLIFPLYMLPFLVNALSHWVQTPVLSLHEIVFLVLLVAVTWRYRRFVRTENLLPAGNRFD